MTSKAKPVVGHKCQSVSYGVTVACECGWHSSVWFGKGVRTQAFGEFNNHRDKHRHPTTVSLKNANGEKQ